MSTSRDAENSSVSASRETGIRGELQAARFLEANGYRIVLTNFKVPIGRNTKGVAVTGEVDIIALDGEVLCFVEVKTRAFDPFAYPLTAVDLRKQRQITRTSRVYRRIFGIRDMAVRFDVVSIILGRGEEPSDISVAKGYWSESTFRKKTWEPRF